MRGRTVIENEKSVNQKKGSFLVNICCCENATWQGYVVWAERNQKEYFKSALELILLLDGALEAAAGESEERTDAIPESQAANDR